MNPAFARDKLLADPIGKALCDLLFETDPMGLSIDGKNTDEYYPEVSTIQPRLGACRSVDDVLLVVHEEFIHWFAGTNGTDDELNIDLVPNRECFEPIAVRIWELAKAHGIITP